jgi:hypothetical protein
MIKRVEQEGWVDEETFTKTLAVYQVLPGPEAHELCVYFGRIRGGKRGALLAGLGFMLPGFLLMLILSVLYVEANLAEHLDEMFYGRFYVKNVMGVGVLSRGLGGCRRRQMRQCCYQGSNSVLIHGSTDAAVPSRMGRSSGCSGARVSRRTAVGGEAPVRRRRARRGRRPAVSRARRRR